MNDVSMPGLMLVIGSNPSQPPGGCHLDEERREARRKDRAGRPARDRPSPPRLARCPSRPDTDVAVLNALILHGDRHEGAGRRGLHPDRADGYAALKANVRGCSPGHGAVCGIPAATLREVARPLPQAKSSMILNGAWASPARARHRQRALPDRAVRLSPADQAPAAACTRCAARTTCRGQRRRPDPR